MQHNIQQPTEAHWTNLILETEQAIRLLEPRIRDAYRFMATRELKQICNSNHNTNNTHKRKLHIAKNIYHKINKNAMITQSTKAKPQSLYTNKIIMTKYTPSS